MKIFMLKAKKFIKRNIYPITVSLCTALMIAIISISAISSIKEASNSNIIDTNQSTNIGDKDENNNGQNGGNGSGSNNNGGNGTGGNNGENGGEVSKPTGSNDPIIFNLPFENATVSKEYADNKLLYDKTTNFWATHQGLDFACNDGQKVYAIYDGTITKVENSMMNGTVIYLKISDNLTVVYKGLASDIRVKEGDKVKKGQELGKITTMLSEKADGIHLHLELLKDDKLIDPIDYFSFNK